MIKGSRGGKREGAGRPEGTVKLESEKVKPRRIDMTDKEYQKYLSNGGARWLRPILRGDE